ncbi:GNAT family N-acetyltransferase [Litchfieldia alkalitelluris]|uniref:GNAT family N-acetyltransferase n=1 Tax=Litchfieldia alkalitelluris TaxID=304268 RepID=UPI0009979CD2|nr:GNAT family N-acetyltransferase [Litchfieldia alkalitelluris]
MINPLKATSIITLQFYHQDHYASLKNFYLTPAQLKFTALPHDVLEIAIKDSYRHPVVIEVEGKPVGFFVLHHGSEIQEYTTNPKAILLRAFSINFNEQRKGYASKALEALPSFVRDNFNNFDEIVLAVNKQNDQAIKLYEKANFLYRGKKRYGLFGMQYILHYSFEIKE